MSKILLYTGTQRSRPIQEEQPKTVVHKVCTSDHTDSLSQNSLITRDSYQMCLCSSSLADLIRIVSASKIHRYSNTDPCGVKAVFV